jgi:spore maturation protein CgeB
VKGSDISQFPSLERTWQGEKAGLEMLEIYRQSKIVLNDYVDMAGGTNVNIRTKEVLGVGSLLLTRQADNIRELEQEGALATFRDADECVVKIRCLLENDEEREKIAARGLHVALERFNYRDIAKRVMEVISEAHEKKCGRLKPWQDCE